MEYFEVSETGVDLEREEKAIFDFENGRGALRSGLDLVLW
jgi:hypothetical protein